MSVYGVFMFIKNNHFTNVSHISELRNWCNLPCYDSRSAHVVTCTEQDDEGYLVETIATDSPKTGPLLEKSDTVDVVHYQFSRFDPSSAAWGSDKVRKLAKRARGWSHLVLKIVLQFEHGGVIIHKYRTTCKIVVIELRNNVVLEDVIRYLMPVNVPSRPFRIFAVI